jgi:N-methylhydantoinase B/oxoprolinase/acetone carboxylase alpha subunit
MQVGTISAEDTMDDGSPIKLAVTIDRSDGSAVFDFEGSHTTAAWLYHCMQARRPAAPCRAGTGMHGMCCVKG